MQPEQDFFPCPTCGEQVPTQNKTLHSLACERRQKHLSSQPMKPKSSSPTIEELPPNDTEDGVVFSAPAEQEQTPLSSTHHRQISTVTSIASEPAPSVVSDSATHHNHSSNASLHALTTLVCAFCDLDLPAVEHEYHETRCGTRTDVCAACSHRVRKRDWPLHMDTACQFGATTGATSGRRPEAEPLLSRDEPSTFDSSWMTTAVAAAAATAAAAVAIGMLSGRRRRR